MATDDRLVEINIEANLGQPNAMHENSTCVQSCTLKLKDNGLITSSPSTLINGIETLIPSSHSSCLTTVGAVDESNGTTAHDKSSQAYNERQTFGPCETSIPVSCGERVVADQNSDSRLEDVNMDSPPGVACVTNGEHEKMEDSNMSTKLKNSVSTKSRQTSQDLHITDVSGSHTDNSMHDHSSSLMFDGDYNTVLKSSRLLTNQDNSEQALLHRNESESSVQSPLVSNAVTKLLPELANDCSNMSNASEGSQASQETQSQEIGGESETGNSSKGSSKKKKAASRRRTDLTMHALNGSVDHTGLTADKLVEYRWPDGKGGQWFMIQEQVSEFLGVVSFKRKYPMLDRRAVEPEERHMLQEKGLVTEMQSDLGLTPVRADQIHDLMSRDYPLKFQEFLLVLRERKKKQQIERHKELLEQRNDKARMAQLRQKAIGMAAHFNTSLNRERQEERRGYIDLQTYEIHYPKQTLVVVPPEQTRIGQYPVALLPGQFQDYYRRYTSEDLKRLPINTAFHPMHKAETVAGPSQDDDASSVSTEASRLVNSEGESVELGSDIFDDCAELEDDPDNGKTKEEKQKEIDYKVKELLDQLHAKSKPGPKGKRKVASGAVPATPTSQSSVENTPMKAARRKRNIKDEPGTPQSAKAPKKSKKQNPPPLYYCNICGGNEDKNKEGGKEQMVQCAQCQRYGHPKCLELTEELIPVIKTYPWQCMECKTCVECNDAQHEDKMLFCDHCDRGYHTFCVGLAAIPNGRWECSSCVPSISHPLTDKRS